MFINVNEWLSKDSCLPVQLVDLGAGAAALPVLGLGPVAAAADDRSDVGRIAVWFFAVFDLKCLKV